MWARLTILGSYLGNWANVYPARQIFIPYISRRGLSSLPVETISSSTTALDARKPFSVVFVAELKPDYSIEEQVTLRAHGTDIRFTADPVTATCSDGSYLATNLHSSVTVGERPFVVTFVQDVEQLQAHLYVNGRLESSARISGITSNDYMVELRWRQHVHHESLPSGMLGKVYSSTPVSVITARNYTSTLTSTQILGGGFYDVAPELVCPPFP